MSRSRWWMLADARGAVQSAFFRLFDLEDALRKAEKSVPPMAAVFDCWRAELRSKAYDASDRAAVDRLPDHPMVERVKFYRSYIKEQEKVVEAAKAELARIEALPPEPPPPERYGPWLPSICPEIELDLDMLF